MYIVKSVVAVRGTSNDMEAEIVEAFKDAMRTAFGEHQLTEILIECIEVIAGERV